VAVLRILYKTKATIIARIRTMISVIGNTIFLRRSSTYL
jgi:hypothetical protein